MKYGAPLFGMLVALVGGLGAAPAAVAQELYMMYGGDEPWLSVVDAETGEIVDGRPILGATRINRGLAMRWDGMLFTIDRVANNDDRLFRFSAKTGEGQAVGGPLPEDANIIALGADPNTGRLYGTGTTNDLYRIDHKTGEATLVGHIEADQPLNPIIAMAIGRDGRGYVTDMYNISLFRVDLETAGAEFVCGLGSMYWYTDMGFDEGGKLWAVLEWNGQLRDVDIKTCQLRPLTDEWYVSGLEVAPAGDGCYSDCDFNGDLDLFDFLCFINAFNVGDDKANCNGDGKFDLFDFLCFVNSFNAGC